MTKTPKNDAEKIILGVCALTKAPQAGTKQENSPWTDLTAVVPTNFVMKMWMHDRSEEPGKQLQNLVTHEAAHYWVGQLDSFHSNEINFSTQSQIGKVFIFSFSGWRAGPT